MKFLITGATGFVGQSLVRRLRQLNHDIVVLSRNAEQAKNKLPYHLEAYSWNPEREVAPAKAFENVDVLIHLAGEGVADKRWSPTQKEKIRSSRELGTRNLVTAINQLQIKPKALISTSAIGVYGNRGDEPLPEDSSVGQGDFLSAVCKIWEAEALKANAIRTCIVRVGIVLGTNGGALAKMLLPFKMGVGGKLGSGKQWMSWIHIDDLVALYIHLATSENASGIFNGTAPNPETNLQFTKILGTVLKRPTLAAVPAFALKILAGEMSDILLNSQRCEPERVVQSGFQFCFPFLQDALGNLVKKKANELIIEQFIPQSREQTFAFFSDAHNLEKITPDWLHFRILNREPIDLKPGTLINYRLKIRGIPFSWQTLIEEFEPKNRFVDSQRKGPYKIWHHTHEFIETENGTVIRDSIRYQAPLSFLTDGFVKRDVQKIFAYRKSAIAKLLAV